MPPTDNRLFYGDNLDVLRRHVDPKSVDLVYLDPPFNSNANYNVLFAAKNGAQAAAQIQAFEDTWQWDTAAAAQLRESIEQGGKVSEVLQAFRLFLGDSDMLAYLAMMAPRLVELHHVLKDTGSLYLHCDPTAGHYLKLLLDAVFQPQNFRNEIIWRRSGSHNSAKRYGPIHDTILFYSKTDAYKWRRVYRPYLAGHVESYFNKRDDRGRYWTNALTGAGVRHGESGKPWKGYDPTPVGRHWAIPGSLVEELGLDPSLSVQERLDALDAAGFIDKPATGSQAMPTYRQYLADSAGMPLQDIWAYQPHTRGALYGTDENLDEDVRWLNKQGDPERLGYQTQKPVGLLRRIIESSTDEGDRVLDPFCGCGTTIAAAQKLGRRWIGIDITHLAIGLIKTRLRDAYGAEAKYEVIGEPTTVEDAARLAVDEPYQFQAWALGLVGARQAGQIKKGADKGIDGRLYFHEGTGKTRQILLSVKAGKLHANHVRDLRGVLEREKADIAVLLSFEPPTKPMRQEAASAGFYTSPWGQHPRLQLLTVAELLEGKGIDYPRTAGVNQTYKAAPRVRQPDAAPLALDLDGGDVRPVVEPVTPPYPNRRRKR